MTVSVEIPDALRKLTNNRATVNVEIGDVSSIDSLIDNVEAMHPGFKDKLVKNGEFRGYVKIFVNDEDIAFIDGKGTEVKDGDRVTIMAAIAGG